MAAAEAALRDLHNDETSPSAWWLFALLMRSNRLTKSAFLTIEPNQLRSVSRTAVKTKWSDAVRRHLCPLWAPRFARRGASHASCFRPMSS